VILTVEVLATTPGKVEVSQVASNLTKRGPMMWNLTSFDTSAPAPPTGDQLAAQAIDGAADAHTVNTTPKSKALLRDNVFI
jgi:hypothetical protein